MIGFRSTNTWDTHHLLSRFSYTITKKIVVILSSLSDSAVLHIIRRFEVDDKQYNLVCLHNADTRIGIALDVSSRKGL